MVKDDGMTLSDKGAHIMGDLISMEIQVPTLPADSQNSRSRNPSTNSNPIVPPRSILGSYTGSTNQKPSASPQPALSHHVSSSASSRIQQTPHEVAVQIQVKVTLHQA